MAAGGGAKDKKTHFYLSVRASPSGKTEAEAQKKNKRKGD